MKKRPVSIFTAIVLIVLLGSLCAALVSLYGRIRALETENSRLQESVRRETAINDQLRYVVEHSDDDAVIAQVAREELGYVYPDETVYTAED